MKLLVINNNTYYKNRLISLLNTHEVDFVDHDNLKELDTSGYDAIILSGGGIKVEGRKRSLKKFSHLYQDQIELVKNTNKPVVGICLGSQIIGHAFGAELHLHFKQRRKGLFPIVAIRENSVMDGEEEAIVFQSNRWMITELPDELICIAASDQGAEIIKHDKKPIWGVQFHPEREKADGAGRKIFNNILGKIESSSKTDF